MYFGPGAQPEPDPDPDGGDVEVIERRRKASKEEYRRSISPDLVTMEDLQPGRPDGFVFNQDRAEWEFYILSSTYPKKIIGCVIMKLKDDGSLVLTLD